MSKRHAVKDERRDLPFMVHSELDDLGLSPYEFRVYAHMVRRAGDRDGAYWESVKSGAEHCRMDVKTYRAALAALEALRLVVRVDRPGQTSEYRLTSRSDWRPLPKTGGAPLPNPVLPNPVPLPETVGDPYQKREGTPTGNGTQRESPEGNPLKVIQRDASAKPTKPQGFDPKTIPLPDHVTPDVWASFVEHRAERRKPLTARAVQLILADLAKTPFDADEMLRRTITNGWTGVFPLDKPTRGTPELRAARSATDLLAHLERRSKP